MVKNFADSSTTLTSASFNTTAANSLILQMLFATANITISNPTHYTSADDLHDATASHHICYETIATSGAASDAISVSVSSTNWTSMGVELLSTAPAVANYGFNMPMLGI